MTEDTDHYIPIECGLHSKYELAIMHKTKSTLQWLDSNNTKQTETVIPVDIFVNNKQEYLKVTTAANRTLKIRLDKIVRLQPI